MMTRRMRWVAAIVALTVGLTGCSLMPAAPQEMSAAVDEATETIRRLDGVASATSSISLWNAEAGAWRAHITVEARDSDVDLRTLVTSVEQTSSIGVVPASAVVTIPGSHDVAETRVTFTALPSMTPRTSDEVADAALALRTVAGVRSVSMSNDGEPSAVTVGSTASATRLTAAIRSLPGFGANALSAVRLSAADDTADFAVTFDTVSPSAALLGVLDDLRSEAGARSVTFSGVDAKDHSAPWRPTLDIAAADAARAGVITARLTTLDDAVTTATGVPRASFTVSAPGASTPSTTTGYLGLPPGSPEPDDLGLSPPAGTSPGDPDAPMASTQLERDSALVTALLDAAGDTAGIRGPAVVAAVTCDNGTTEQVQGSVVIPIFEIADSADDAFEAIVSSWETQRFTRSDRAMGTDYYSAPDGSLDILSIRGTAAGISIVASTPCVVAP
jgi:hypothetical protein